MIFKNSHFRKVGYPHEHGSWGFFLEPILLALLIAYSFYGVLLSLSAFCLFLAYQPMSFILKGNPKYLLKDAYYYLLTYSVISILIILYLSLKIQSPNSLIPFIIAILLMIFYKRLEYKNLNRKIIVEIIPQIAVVLISVSILLLNNWPLAYLIGFAFIVLSRSVQTVFYINNKLKFFKKIDSNKLLVHLVGILFLIILTFLAIYNFVPWSSITAIVLLMLRSIVGFFEKNRSEKVKIVGIKEFIYGFLFVGIISIGYNFGF